MIANTPKPPYVAAIFTSIRTNVEKGYDKMDELTFKEIETINGYLGCEAYRDENGFGVNVSYWKNLNALKIGKKTLFIKKHRP